MALFGALQLLPSRRGLRTTVAAHPQSNKGEAGPCGLRCEIDTTRDAKCDIDREN